MVTETSVLNFLFLPDKSLGMQVMYYDVVEKLSLGNAYKCGSLRGLTKKADIITLHVDGSETNTNLIGENNLK